MASSVSTSVDTLRQKLLQRAKTIIRAMTLQLLGGISSRQFLARHWQKRPLLVRNAMPGFAGFAQTTDLFRLAERDDVETRAIERHGRRWSLEHGPFTRRSFAARPARNWTLLVSGLNNHLPEADALLRDFRFLPYSRLDDVMVSYAAPGGGVGPHFDSYDVFLLQGFGRRHWKIGPARGAKTVEGNFLRQLADFKPEEEMILEPGDMLYLPPGWGHDGVAVDHCTTYSVGFRSPTAQELAIEFLRSFEDEVKLDGLYADPKLRSTARPAAIPDDMIRFARSSIGRMRWRNASIDDFLGRYLSEPKAIVNFNPRARKPPVAAFAKQLARSGARLDARTLLLYRGRRFFVNGESFDPARTEAGPLAKLANNRRLPAGPQGQDLAARLSDWYLHGWLHLGADDVDGADRTRP